MLSISVGVAKLQSRFWGWTTITIYHEVCKKRSINFLSVHLLLSIIYNKVLVIKAHTVILDSVVLYPLAALYYYSKQTYQRFPRGSFIDKQIQNGTHQKEQRGRELYCSHPSLLPIGGDLGIFQRINRSL